MKLPSLLPLKNSYYQIVKLKNLNYQPPDENYNFEWLEFEGDVLYTNSRTHSSTQNLILGNCKAIEEKLNDFLIEHYVKMYNLWKPTENQMSDLEFEHNKKKYQEQLEFNL